MSARAWALGVPRNVSKNISTMYEDARNVGLVQANPFSNLRLPATEKTELVAPPTLAEFHALLAACMVHGNYAPEMRAMLTFTAWTGLRSGEVQGLKWDDIDSDTIEFAGQGRTTAHMAYPRRQRADDCVFRAGESA